MASIPVTLHVTQGPYAGQAFHVVVRERETRRTQVRLGRAKTQWTRKCGVCMPDDDELSTSHARLKYGAGDRVLFFDVGSTNGSEVDGRDAEEGVMVELKTGSILRLGQALMTVTIDTESGATAAYPIDTENNNCGNNSPVASAIDEVGGCRRGRGKAGTLGSVTAVSSGGQHANGDRKRRRSTCPSLGAIMPPKPPPMRDTPCVHTSAEQLRQYAAAASQGSDAQLLEMMHENVMEEQHSGHSRTLMPETFGALGAAQRHQLWEDVHKWLACALAHDDASAFVDADATDASYAEAEGRGADEEDGVCLSCFPRGGGAYHKGQRVELVVGECFEGAEAARAAGERGGTAWVDAAGVMHGLNEAVQTADSGPTPARVTGPIRARVERVYPSGLYDLSLSPHPAGHDHTATPPIAAECVHPARLRPGCWGPRGQLLRKVRAALPRLRAAACLLEAAAEVNTAPRAVIPWPVTIASLLAEPALMLALRDLGPPGQALQRRLVALMEGWLHTAVAATKAARKEGRADERDGSSDCAPQDAGSAAIAACVRKLARVVLPFIVAESTSNSVAGSRRQQAARRAGNLHGLLPLIDLGSDTSAPFVRDLQLCFIQPEYWRDDRPGQDGRALLCACLSASSACFANAFLYGLGPDDDDGCNDDSDDGDDTFSSAQLMEPVYTSSTLEQLVAQPLAQLKAQLRGFQPCTGGQLDSDFSDWEGNACSQEKRSTPRAVRQLYPDDQERQVQEAQLLRLKAKLAKALLAVRDATFRFDVLLQAWRSTCAAPEARERFEQHYLQPLFDILVNCSDLLDGARLSCFCYALAPIVRANPVFRAALLRACETPASRALGPKRWRPGVREEESAIILWRTLIPRDPVGAQLLGSEHAHTSLERALEAAASAAAPLLERAAPLRELCDGGETGAIRMLHALESKPAAHVELPRPRAEVLSDAVLSALCAFADFAWQLDGHAGPMAQARARAECDGAWALGVDTEHAIQARALAVQGGDYEDYEDYEALGTRSDGQFRVALSLAQLNLLAGHHAVSYLVSSFGGVPDQIQLRRATATGDAAEVKRCIRLHVDRGVARTMQVPLNEPCEYTGGELLFASFEHGVQCPSRAAGSATIHDCTLPHCVTELRHGTRYGLFLLGGEPPTTDFDDVVETIEDGGWFSEDEGEEY